MATWIYNDGDKCLVESSRLELYLKAGWSVEEKADSKVREAPDVSKLSNKEVRAAAAEAGIEDADKKRVSTLRGELENVESTSE